MGAIEFHRVTKAYQLGAGRTNLRETLASAALRAIGRRPAQADRRFLALDDVSFTVAPGEALGIIGHNGAGKSTALKLLSKVTFPTSGQVKISGRVAALIELGAGFHPDLSGRENVYLAGAMLGLRRHEINAQFSSIVEFAGLERFIDTPVKRYSSGMYVRLAFAVAAHVRADVLLVDEVLSVGDTSFQQRCLDKMSELHRNGATVVLVSHNLWTVESFCARAVLLSQGRVAADGAPSAVIERYRELEREGQLAAADAAPIPDAAVARLDLLDREGRPLREVDPGGYVVARVSYATPRPLRNPVFLVRIRRADGLVCCALHTRFAAEVVPDAIEGEGAVEACIGSLPLVPDVYTVEALIIDRHQPIVYAASERELLRVAGPLSESKDAGVFAPNVEWYADSAIRSL